MDTIPMPYDIATGVISIAIILLIFYYIYKKAQEEKMREAMREADFTQEPPKQKAEEEQK